MLRYRIICGVNHKAITNHLLAERKLDFKKALELAKAIESAEKDTRQIQDTPSTGVSSMQVHHATDRQKQRGRHPPKQSECSHASDTADLINCQNVVLSKLFATDARSVGISSECADQNRISERRLRRASTQFKQRRTETLPQAKMTAVLTLCSQ